MIVLAGATSGIPKELFSDEELRDGSSRLLKKEPTR
jgi:hypothetical protein